MPFSYIPNLHQSAKTKIVLLVIDGLGGLPLMLGGKTELESALTQHMDRLAEEGTLGQTIPIRPGITPGSGPAHLALFGYDPLEFAVGRGALSAAGVGMTIAPGDVAARGNFCTLDEFGNIIDRRAGRISSQEAAPLVDRLRSIHLPNVDIEIRQVKEYRFTVIMRGPGLDSRLKDTDPQKTGVPPLPVQTIFPEADLAATLFNHWIAKATDLLSDIPQANGVTLRGFATDPELQSFQDAYGLKAACVAVYPMYRGVARLVGMDVIQFKGDTPEDEFSAVKRVWDNYDFFFVHIKKIDSKGEDGDFEGKADAISSVDNALPSLLELNPDVLIITGDHSTPALLRSHSWHPVPFLLWAPATHRSDSQKHFGERNCAVGGLGTFLAVETMTLALAHAKRLTKYGA